jgi:hypothetical protein
MTSSDRDRLRRALDDMVHLPRLRERQAAGGGAAALLVAGGGPPGAGRPWDRGDLLRRLQTFRAATWFAKPEAISPVECARRGWANAGPDLLRCESCRGAVSAPLPPALLPDQAAAAAERTAARLEAAHEDGCPWRGAVASLALLQFPELSRGAAALDFADRAAGLARAACLPPLAPSALEAAAGAGQAGALEALLRRGPGRGAAGAPADGPELLGDLAPALGRGVATCESAAYAARLRLLALCGWGLRVMAAGAGPAGEGGGEEAAEGDAAPPALVGPESASLACALCGARAGLWGFFAGCAPRAAAAAPAPRRRFGAPAGTPAVAGAATRNVASDLTTTIAGGAVGAPGGAATAGPFGSPAPAARPLGGAPGSAPPPATAQASPAASPAPFGSASRAAAASPPVFGFEALRAAEPGAVGRRFSFGGDAAAAPAEARKRAADGAADAGDGDGGADKRPRLNAPSPAAPPRRAPLPAAAQLAKLRALDAHALDPLALHRPFCPWAAAPRVGGDAGGPPGWRWALRQLAPAATDGAEGEVAGDAGGGAADVEAWDPGALLRKALGKVEVGRRG